MGDQLLHSLLLDGEYVDVDMPMDTKGQHNQLVKKKSTVQRRIPYLDIVATKCTQTDDVTLFIVNKHPNKDYSLDINLMECEGDYQERKLYTVYHPDIRARNSAQTPDKIRTSEITLPRNDNSVNIKAHSINAITFSVK